jgi:OHCU decarboxylase
VTLASRATAAEFIGRFGDVYEHSPWVAEQCFTAARGLTDAEKIAAIFAACVDRADRNTKLALIRAHPDLGDRAAERRDHVALTEASSAEQASAGIDQCSPEELRRFHECNERYKAKFGFPFIMAVRNSNRHEILAAFAERLEHDREAEFNRAISEIHKIARLRLSKMFEDSSVA